MQSHNSHTKKKAQPKKSFAGLQGAVFQKSPRVAGVYLFLLFIFPAFLMATGDYQLISWEGEVKVRQGETFLQLTQQANIQLQAKDAIWMANGAKIELGCPDGSTRKINGPRFSLIETLATVKTEKQPSFFAIFIENLELGEYIARDKEKRVGGTRAQGFESSEDFYEQVKKAIPKMEEGTPPVENSNGLEEALTNVDQNFDAAPPEVKILLKASVYKHFNQGQQALMTVFEYYETILKVKEKQNERALMEEFLINEVLPVMVTYEVEEQSLLYDGELDNNPRVSLRLNSNFKVWWAAFSFDGQEFKEIEKTIDNQRNPQETFFIKNHPMGNEKKELYSLFIIANPVWSQLEKYDDIEVTRKELLNEKIKETDSNTARGFSGVTVKINLSKIRRLMEEKVKQARQLGFRLVCLFFGICNL